MRIEVRDLLVTFMKKSKIDENVGWHVSSLLSFPGHQRRHILQKSAGPTWSSTPPLEGKFGSYETAKFPGPDMVDYPRGVVDHAGTEARPCRVCWTDGLLTMVVEGRRDVGSKLARDSFIS